MVFSKFHPGDKCQCMHPYAYRGEAPFTIIKILWVNKRACYEVEYADGKRDQIPIKNEGGYEMQLVVSSQSEVKTP